MSTEHRETGRTTPAPSSTVADRVPRAYPELTPAEARRRAAVLTKAGWHAEAVDLLLPLVATDMARDIGFRFQLARALLAAGRFEEAERVPLRGGFPNDRDGAAGAPG